MAPTTAGALNQQLKPNTVQSGVPKTQPAKSSPDHFDALIDGMQRTMLGNHSTDVKIMSHLNKRSVANIRFSTEQELLRDERVTADIAQLVLDSDWTEEQKFSVALSNRERARLWAQMIAIMPQLDASTLNRLASLTYTTDQYIWDDELLLVAKISGSLRRWAATKSRDVREQLAAFLAVMEKASGGSRLTLVNGRAPGEGCVEIVLSGAALNAAS